MPPPIVQRPSGVNVGVNNPGDTVYLVGNEFTDGSIKYVLEPGDTEVTLEKRADGVFNPTGLRLAANTLFLDRQLSISSIGVSIQVDAIGSGEKFLVPCVLFDDTGSEQAQAQIVDELVENFVVQPVFDTDDVSTAHSESLTVIFTRVVTIVKLKTGATAASTDVQFILSQGLSPGGTILSLINFPASKFPANSDITIIFDPGIGVATDDDITFGFFSDNAFSLLGDSSGDMFIAIDTQLIDFQDIVVENLILDNNLDIMLDNDLNPMYANNF